MSKCELCGEPMPPGEEMFKYHGYSRSCPKPPLPRSTEFAAGEPVEESTDSIGSWQCKDYADGWITFPDRKSAERYQEQTGALMRYQRIYAAPRAEPSNTCIWRTKDGVLHEDVIEPTNAAPQDSGKVEPNDRATASQVSVSDTNPAGAAPTPETDSLIQRYDPSPNILGIMVEHKLGRFIFYQQHVAEVRELARERNEARKHTPHNYVHKQMYLQVKKCAEEAEAKLALEKQNHATDVALWEIDATKLADMQKRLDDAAAELPSNPEWPSWYNSLPRHETLDFIESLRTAAVAAIAKRDAEIARLREGAARYQWARQNLVSICYVSGRHGSGQTHIQPVGDLNTPDYWDAAIDAARKK